MRCELSEEYDADEDDAEDSEQAESWRLEFDVERAESENQENARNRRDGRGDIFAEGGFHFAPAFDGELGFKFVAVLEGALRESEFFGFLVGHGQELAFFHENFGGAPEGLGGAVEDGVFFTFDNEHRVALRLFTLVERGGEFKNFKFRRHEGGTQQLRVAVALGKVPELGAERGLDFFADDLRCAVAALHDGGAVADSRCFEHVEFLTSECDEATCADGLLFHECDGGRTLDGHDGVDQVEGCVEAAAEGVDFEDDVVGVFLKRVVDGAGAEIVHGGFHVTFQLDPDCMLFAFGCFSGGVATGGIRGGFNR